MSSVRVVGMGRVGSALAAGLAAAGWTVAGPLGRNDDPAGAGRGVDLVAIATPDAAVAAVAARIEPTTAVVAHLAGSLGLAALAPHERVMALHPLASIPAGPLGVQRLTAGVRFAVAGDPLVFDVVSALGGTPFVVADEHRLAYHAAACIASNHTVALLGQVERVAAQAGLELDVFLGLVEGTLASVAAVGPAAALTGPAARGDQATIDGHLSVLPEGERPAYRALADLARRLATEPR